MNEDFVSFELAKKLKEKGFYYKCLTTYDNDGMLGYNYIQPTDVYAIGFDDCLCSHNVENDGCIDAPTISQVLKWLREEKKIHIAVGYSGETYWRYVIVFLGDKYFDNPNIICKHFDSYESAAIASIENVLDNLI